MLAAGDTKYQTGSSSIEPKSQPGLIGGRYPNREPKQVPLLNYKLKMRSTLAEQTKKKIQNRIASKGVYVASKGNPSA